MKHLSHKHSEQFCARTWRKHYPDFTTVPSTWLNSGGSRHFNGKKWIIEVEHLVGKYNQNVQRPRWVYCQLFFQFLFKVLWKERQKFDWLVRFFESRLWIYIADWMIDLKGPFCKTGTGVHRRFVRFAGYAMFEETDEFVDTLILRPFQLE